MKSIWIGVLLIFLVFLTFGCRGATEPLSVPADSGQGKVVFLISDAAADISTFSKLNMTVSNVQVHSQTQGWVALSAGSQTYDLLELRAKSTNKVLVTTDLATDTYDKVRLTVNNVVVVDSRGSQQANMPNNTMEIQSAFSVKPNATATVSFDFVADQSLHSTTEARYVFAPVIKIETRNNADVRMKSNSEAEVSGGQVMTATQVGMDINGNVGVGLKIIPDTILSITSSGIITAGAQGAGGAQSSVALTTQGTLQSVDNVGGNITVMTDTGQQLVLRLSNVTQLSATELSSKVGSKVKVGYDSNTSTVNTVQVLSTSGQGTASVSGTLTNVNSAAGTITVQTDSGQELVLKTTSSTQIRASSVGGLVSSLLSLVSYIGARVQVGYNVNTSTATTISLQ